MAPPGVARRESRELLVAAAAATAAAAAAELSVVWPFWLVGARPASGELDCEVVAASGTC